MSPIKLKPAQVKRLERNLIKSGSIPEFRPDLTDYRIYIELLADKLNQEALYRMSLTDIIKILIEQKISEVLPDVIINKTRKRYIKLDY